MFIAPLTWLLIGATCIVSFAAFKRPKLGQKLVLWPPAVTRGHEYWRLLTSGFVHADLQHLLFNMITLFFFGGLVERFFSAYLGAVGYLLFYLGGIIVAIAPSYLGHRHDANYVSLGASGAVAAVMFAFILMQPWALIFVFFFPLPAVLYAVMFVGYSIYMDKRGGDHVNHSAHMWGAAYGILVTVATQPYVVVRFVEQLQHPHF
ncbi:MAG TPA: rhomboid family intramembrane serine protease [Rhodanobacteraceae bacterium]